MPTILIAGGTGLIGRALTGHLTAKGYDLIILTRRRQAGEAGSSPGIRYACWDPGQGTVDRWAIQEADAIIHLAGANLAEGRWTRRRKKEIAESRMKTADLLVSTLKETPNKVSLLVSMSAIGWYKPSLPAEGEHMRVETDPPDPGFLGRTCRLWEQHIQPVSSLGIRLVILRTGIVLSREGGAFPEFCRPIRRGIAAVLGSGRQVISWIHIEDLCRIIGTAIADPQWNGIYNAVAPMPVTNKTLTLELARLMKGKYFLTIHVPALFLKILLGELSIEVLKSARISAEKTRQTGFQFLFPGIRSALENLVQARGTAPPS